MASEASWRRISAIFEEALTISPERRDDWIDEACGGDGAIRQEVERLLAATDRSKGVLDALPFKTSPSESAGAHFVMPAGTRIGSYRIVAENGRGGMGIVYEAVDTRLERTVALKVLYPYLLNDTEVKARFKREAQAAASLNHPNICHVYEIGETEEQLYISMAYIEGKNLEQRIEVGPLKLEQALDIATQAARGLQAAHAKSIVHRDIKPSNIMVGDDGHVTVMDFGLAQLSDRSTLTREGAVLGTAAYMSPEQARGQQTDPRTDIWSLGVVLYEMLAGRRPFTGEYQQAISYEIVNEEPEPLTAVRSGIPMDLERLVQKALAKRVDERYASAESVLVDLRVLGRRAANETTIGYRSSHSRTPVPREGILQRRVPLSGVLAVGALLTAVAATWFWLATGEPSADLLSRSKLTRLTTGVGLTTTPALSFDGNLVAYACDRGDEDNLDIWMQQVSGGPAVRLTEDPAADHRPAFSPDGKTIAFQSDREGGGVYVIPTLGGRPRLVVRGGQRPRFSRDGRSITYYAGPPSSLKGTTVHVVSSDGGEPRALVSDFEVSAMPIWAPDSRHVLFWGNRPGEPPDIWRVQTEGGSPVATGAAASLRDEGLNLISLDGWAASGDYVVFSGIVEDSVNLWRLPVSSGSSWGISRRPERLTLGVDEREASVGPDGRIVFTTSVRRINLWRLPLSVNDGLRPGTMERLTDGATADFSPDVTLDGARVSFRSGRSGNIDAWIQDVRTRRQTPLTTNAAAESAPRLNHDGSQVVFSTVENGQRPMYTVNADTGLARKICDHCGPPHGWTADGGRIVYQHVERKKSAIHLLDLATGEHGPIARHTDFPLFAARLSRDDQWLAFKGDVTIDRTQIFVAGMPSGKSIPQAPIPVDKWIPVSGTETWDDLPRWSPNGKLIYFTSDRDGFRCIWAQRFDPVAGQTVGEPFAVRHFHRRRLSLSTLRLSELELAVSRSGLYFPLAEVTGNIWLAEPTRPRP